MAEVGTRGRGPGRLGSLALGIVLVLVGIPMLVCPGPGIGSILAGVGLIAYGITGRR